MPFRRVRLRDAWNWGGLSFRELAARTWAAIDNHVTLNQAAVVAFWTMLALVPLLGLVLALAVGMQRGVAAEILSLSAKFLPHEADVLVRDQIRKIQSETPVAVLSLSAAVLLWSASSLFVAVMDAINTAYGVRDGRPFWKRRLLALFLTLIGVVLVIGASVSAVAWPVVVDWLDLRGLASAGATMVQWVAVIAALFVACEVAYYFGADIKQNWKWITPGATLGVLVLIAASMAFRLYLYFGASYSETYGALAGVVLLMLWLYIASLALLVGAEVNGVIEHAAAQAKAQDQKTAP